MDTFRPGGLELTDKAAKLVCFGSGDKVLDMGCGFGTSLLFLREKYNIDPYGIDINKNAVEKSKALIGENSVFCNGASDVPFLDCIFKAVYIECVLSLCNDPIAVLKEAKRVLSPGGYLVISTLDGAEVLVENGRIGREQLLSVLEDLGFEVTDFFDETAALRQFVAEAIFRYDSIENYIAYANRKMCGAVLNCNVPIKGTGYILIVARLQNKKSP